MKCGSERPLPPVFSVKVFIFFYFMVWLVVILFGCQESVEKLKKIKVFGFFFNNEIEYDKNYGESFNFFYDSACCDFVWLPRKCGKVENFVFIFFFAGSDTIFVSPIFIFIFIKKHKIVFGNLIMICGERLCFSAWLKNCGFRVCEI